MNYTAGRTVRRDTRQKHWRRVFSGTPLAPRGQIPKKEAAARKGGRHFYRM